MKRIIGIISVVILSLGILGGCTKDQELANKIDIKQDQITEIIEMIENGELSVDELKEMQIAKDKLKEELKILEDKYLNK